jgi:hypothetical protein
MIKNMPFEKLPGQDGLSGSYYKFSWDIIKEDFMDAINHFYVTKELPPQWKATFLVLIPKVPNPSSPSHYRPISLCNDSYKIISKLLVNRMKEFLPIIDSPVQSAFVPERCITDNILLAQEVLHSMRKNGRGNKLMAMKVDMERAYDRMA